MNVAFPMELQKYGLNEETLASTFKQFSAHSYPNQELSSELRLSMWTLRGLIPNTEFYQLLHQFLKKWYLTKESTKSDIGRFYMFIDPNLQFEGARPDNVYRFIENTAKYSANSPMSYPNKSTLPAIAGSTSSTRLIPLVNEMQQNTSELENLHSEIRGLKEQLHQSKKQLSSAQTALKDVTNQVQIVKKQRDNARKKMHDHKAIEQSLLEDLAEIQEDHFDLSKYMATLEDELAAVQTSGTGSCCAADFIISTKNGRSYSPGIRKLYYALLANEVPSSKISDIIKAVIRCINPSIDVDQLKLPSKSCASYMRKDELKIVSDAHKATALCQQAANKVGFSLKSDGTTKNLKKIGGVGINDMVISVNELPDGTAETTVKDISQGLHDLRKIANDLGISNADSINWTLFVSTSSDSAASQKKVNRLIEEHRISDESLYGSADVAAVDIIESFCSMHLAVNLRKAFLSGIVDHSSADSTHGTDGYHPVDCFVHQFCKLFGRHGVPEYSCGAHFVDFLSMKATANPDDLSSDICRIYFQQCLDVRLERQVGSRYFVSASNAMRMVFLKSAAIEFLEYTGRVNGTKLEKEVYGKLIDEFQMMLIRIDALMFYFIYADLVTLSKSTELNKSALTMNQHYLELKLFLEDVQQHPHIILKSNTKVFVSEPSLYDVDSKVNHRVHRGSMAMHTLLFKECQGADSTFFPLVVCGARKMIEKLCRYARSNLPGGIYWEPPEEVSRILSQIKPSNDFCESLLGLNDYLTTTLPNLHQVARSNLIEVKKNKTIQWLDELPYDQQSAIIDLAVKKRETVNAETQERSKSIESQRKERMVQHHNQQEIRRKKLELEKSHLRQVQVFLSSEQLHEAIKKIADNESMTSAAKKKEIKILLSSQVKVRKKLLGQNITIKFSQSGRPRPLSEISQELSHFIDESFISTIIADPSLLVGHRIDHKFQENETEKWYSGSVVDYDLGSKVHEVVYDGEQDHCFYDLKIDLLNGDLKITN